MQLLHTMFDVLEEKGDALSFLSHSVYRIEFHADHVIYQAHFPGKPITPGVCIIKIITEILEQQMQQSLLLQEVKNLKFVSPISPIDVPEVDICFSKIEKSVESGLPSSDTYEERSCLQVRGTIFLNDKIYTKFSLIYKIS